MRIWFADRPTWECMFLKSKLLSEEIISLKPCSVNGIQQAVRTFHSFVCPCYGFEFKLNFMRVPFFSIRQTFVLRTGLTTQSQQTQS